VQHRVACRVSSSLAALSSIIQGLKSTLAIDPMAAFPRTGNFLR